MRLFFWYFALLPLLLWAQGGFNRTYDLGCLNTYTLGLLIDRDTIIYHGLAYVPPPVDDWGLSFAKFDTLGNLLSQNVIVDPNGAIYGWLLGKTIQKNPHTGGYALTGSILNKKAGYFMDLDHQGNLVHYKEYPDSLRSRFFSVLVTLPDGFMMLGQKSMPDYLPDAFALKINLKGDKIWEKFYDTPSYWHTVWSAYAQDDNTILIGSLRSTSGNAYTTRARIWAIDSLGQVKWFWEHPEWDKESRITGLQPTPDGGWIYLTERLFRQGSDQPALRPMIVRRDKDLNLIWERYLTYRYHWAYSLAGLEVAPDGGYVACGFWTDSTSTYRGGGFYKFTANGDSLWSRLDTASRGPGGNYDNEYYGLGMLSSGSVVAAGQSYYQPDDRYYVWLVKVDAHGCLDTLFCKPTSGLAPLPTGGMSCRMSPNPTSGATRFEWALPSGEEATLWVYDLRGQAVTSFTLRGKQGELTWDASTLPAGLYAYRLLAEGRSVAAGKIMVNH